MNGHELIYKLNQLSSVELDRQVYSEGCDCTEPADGIRLTTTTEFLDAKYQEVQVIVVSRP